MNETPKRLKRKIKEASPSGFYKNNGNDYEGTAVTYEFHPTESAKLKKKGEPCSNALGKRPQCFIKSPSLQVPTSRKSVQDMTPSHDRELECEKIFKNILEGNEYGNNVSNQDKEIAEKSNSSDRLEFFKEPVVDKQREFFNNDASLLDDSSGDALFLVSQQIENEVEKDDGPSTISPLPLNRSKCDKNKNDFKIKRSSRIIEQNIQAHKSKMKKKSLDKEDYLTQNSSSSNLTDEEPFTVSQTFNHLKNVLRRTPDLVEFLCFEH